MEVTSWTPAYDGEERPWTLSVDRFMQEAVQYELEAEYEVLYPNEEDREWERS